MLASDGLLSKSNSEDPLFASAEEEEAAEEKELEEAAEEEEQEFVVERLLDVRLAEGPGKCGQCVQFLVKWEGYMEPEWWPVETVNDVSALDDFLITPRWAAFSSSPKYQQLCRLHPERAVRSS
mmetsp:Transcript_4859/g.13553  ORF Transcript_4859/g.13553 Transcript_4859/m.13553 type:complete len:124 (-) Transcript_4859:288-659(-)